MTPPTSARASSVHHELSKMRRPIIAALAILLGVVVVSSQSAVDVQIDAAANRHPIDPLVYGVAFADAASMADLRAPINRSGGNATSRYNWQLNASNRAADWYFESIASKSATPGDDGDTFVSQTKSSGAEPVLTIPMIGWVANTGLSRGNLASFSIAKYGPQTASDSQFFADAGNGISAVTGQPIVGNDPTDANVTADAAFQKGWIQHLVTRWGTASNGGVRYYALDNEPSLWHVTHRDVHPTGARMDEVVSDTVAYASQIKAADPQAMVVGPEEWGWSGYFYSGYDQQWGAAHGWNDLPDRTAHANWDYLPWYLDQLRQREVTTGQRLLDMLTVHFYPQGGQSGNDTSTAMQQLRNRSTRALWDPAYVDESWINAPVQLVPRMRNWAATYYPGTKIGITEYNWGAEAHINGATTQADALGIFGRERLDLATRWATPSPSTPTYNAIKLYRNYDNAGSGFGDVSVSAVAPDPDTLSVFAAQRTTDAVLTIMAINKDFSGTTVNLNVANYAGAGSAEVWQLTSSNAITRLADATMSGSTLVTTLPAQSITLFVVRPASTASASAAVKIGTITSAAITAGSLSGTANSNTAAVNLTTEGVADWIHWGETPVNRKAGVTTQLSNYSAVGTGTIASYNNDGRPMSWTDGTPTASNATNKNGLFVWNMGNGFSFNAPAGLSAQTLNVHVGGYYSGGRLTAHLSDGSAADFVDVVAETGGTYDRNYVLTYQAGAAGQQLTVTWTMTAGAGYVSLSGAALTAAAGGSSAAAPPQGSTGLSGTGSSSTTAVSLTTEGATDWIHWGETPVNRKAGVTALLTNYSLVGTGAISSYNNDLRPMSWTDGTPTASSSGNTKGLFVWSVGNGFTFSAPAGTATQTLTLHVGGYYSGGTLTAHLSDGSAPDFVDVQAQTGGYYDRNYVLTYQAAAAGQQLTVTWKMSSGSGYVTLSGAALTASGGSTPSVTATGGTPQSAAVNTAFPVALQATVRDASGNPSSGVNVTFTAPASGASARFSGATTATAVTNASGIATAPTLAANGTTGSYLVTASAPGVPTTASFSLTNSATPPASVSATGGTPQGTVVSTTFATALQATVRDASGNPSNGVVVMFTAPASGPSAGFSGSATATAVTNASGIAIAPALTANSQAGSYAVTASVPGVGTPASFSLTNTAVAAGALSGTGSSSTAAVSLTVEGITDWIHWGETPINRKAGVTALISNYIAVGAASISSYGNDLRQMSWTGGTPSASNVGNTNGLFVWNTGNGFSFSAPAGTALQTLTVHVGGYYSGGTLTAHLSDGSAPDFVDLTAQMGSYYDRNYVLIYQAASAGQQLTVTWKMTSGSGYVTLSGAALTGAGAPSMAATGGTPQSTAVNTAFATPLQTTVRDASGNPSSGVTVTFTAPASGASARFSGATTATAVTNASGIATAPTLTANGTAGSYVVTASAAGVGSSTFNLTNSTGIATATASWNPNSEPNIAGYKLSYGSQSGTYTTTIDVANVTTWLLTLTSGQRYYFVVQAYNTSGLVSPRSSEVVYTAP
jgi:hypothetical protein